MRPRSVVIAWPYASVPPASNITATMNRANQASPGKHRTPGCLAGASGRAKRPANFAGPDAASPAAGRGLGADTKWIMVLNG